MKETPGSQAELTVAAEIRAELARQRISQAELVERLGVSRPWLSRRLSGETQLTIADVATIADLLGVPVARFIDPVDQNEPDGPTGRT